MSLQRTQRPHKKPPPILRLCKVVESPAAARRTHHLPPYENRAQDDRHYNHRLWPRISPAQVSPRRTIPIFCKEA